MRRSHEISSLRAPITHAVRETGGRVSNILSNAVIGAAYTAVDLAESKMFRTASGWVFDGKTHKLEKELHQAVAERNTHMADQVSKMDPQGREMQRLADELQIQIIRDGVRRHESIHGAVEYAEEEVSDQLATKAGQKILNKITGFKDAQLEPDETIGALDWERSRKHLNTYVKAFAENISGYANAVIQVFFNDRWIGFVDKEGKPKVFMGMYMAEKSANFVNPGNVEAGLRILSNIPVIEKVVKPVKDTMDHFLENNEIAKLVNVGITKALLGFHVVNSRAKAVDKATAEIASKTV